MKDVIRFGAITGLGWSPFIESRVEVGSNGEAIVEFPGPPIGFFWHIDRIALHGPNVEVSFYISQVNPMLLVEYSYMVPNIADEAAPIYVPESQPFLAVFVGAAVNDQLCIVHIQGRRYAQGEGNVWDSKAPPEAVAAP